MNTKKPEMKPFFRPRRKVKHLKYLLGKKCQPFMKIMNPKPKLMG